MPKEFTPMNAESAAAFFSELGQNSEQQQQQNQPNNNLEETKQQVPSLGNEQDNKDAIKRMTFASETISRNTNWDEGTEGIIKRNLLIGNLENAADCALKCGRVAEAFLIAEAGGKELYNRVKMEYLANAKDSYVKLVLNSIVNKDLPELISERALTGKITNWKESLAYVLSFGTRREREELAKALGEELLTKKKDINSAIICYMMAFDLGTVIDLWKKRALFLIKNKGQDRNECLFQLFEKIIIYKTVTKQTDRLTDLDLVFADFAEYMAHEDLKFLSMKYTELCNLKQQNIAMVRDRIYHSDDTFSIQKHF